VKKEAANSEASEFESRGSPAAEKALPLPRLHTDVCMQVCVCVKDIYTYIYIPICRYQRKRQGERE